MSTATTSRKKRGTQRHKRQDLARDVANTYWIYINPNSSDLERQVHPIIEAWYQDGTMKEHLLAAIAQYTDTNELQTQETVGVGYEIEQLRDLIKDLAQIVNKGSFFNQNDENNAEEMTTEELEFLNEHLDFSE